MSSQNVRTLGHVLDRRNLLLVQLVIDPLGEGLLLDDWRAQVVAACSDVGKA